MTNDNSPFRLVEREINGKIVKVLQYRTYDIIKNPFGGTLKKCSGWQDVPTVKEGEV